MLTQKDLDLVRNIKGGDKEGIKEAAEAIWAEINDAWAFPEQHPELSQFRKNGNQGSVGQPQIYWEDNCKAYADASAKFRRMSAIDELVEILLKK